MYRLRILDTDLEQLKQLVFAALPKEAGAFALAGISNRRNETTVLVRRVVEVPTSFFLVQHQERLEVTSKAINGLASLCEVNGLGALICHSHPKQIPYSPSDDYGERQVFEAIKPFLSRNAPLASLLLVPGGIDGRIWEPVRRRFLPISEVVVVGRSLTRLQCRNIQGNGARPVEERYDRQVRAFGRHGQEKISCTRVGIVGVGGTGSSVAEQLARLGVGDIVLIDPDFFSVTNLTRMYGTFVPPKYKMRWPWRGRRRKLKKVDLIMSHLKRINLGLQIKAVPKNVVIQDSADFLLDRDVIFLCTDDHWGRSIVNEIAYQYLIPTINLGMSIRAKNGTITAASGSIDIVRPGNACLWCSQSLSSTRIAAESLPREERKLRQCEGYVEDIDTPTPSVISITTMLAGLAVSQFLQLITDFMGEAGDICKLRYNIMDGTVRRGRTTVRLDCLCTKDKGYGDLRPLRTLDSITNRE